MKTQKHAKTFLGTSINQNQETQAFCPRVTEIGDLKKIKNK